MNKRIRIILLTIVKLEVVLTVYVALHSVKNGMRVVAVCYNLSKRSNIFITVTFSDNKINGNSPFSAVKTNLIVQKTHKVILLVRSVYQAEDYRQDIFVQTIILKSMSHFLNIFSLNIHIFLCFSQNQGTFCTKSDDVIYPSQT